MNPNDPFYTSYDKNLYVIPTGQNTALAMLYPAPISTSTIPADQVESGISTGTTVQATGAASKQGKTTFDNTVAGYIIGFDPKDGNAKFYIGNATSYLNWTGSALNITGTITGGTIETATTGQRVVISGADNALYFYDASGQVIDISSSSGNAIALSLTSDTNNGVVISSAVGGNAFYHTNSGNVTGYGLYTNWSGATNSGVGVRIVNAGTTGAIGMLMTTSNSARGIEIDHSAAKESLYINDTGTSGSGDGVYYTYARNGNMINMVASTTGGNLTGIQMNLSSTINVYAFSFQGSEHQASAVSGSQTHRIRVLLPSGLVGYIPIYA